MGAPVLTVFPVPFLYRGTLPDLEVERRRLRLVALGQLILNWWGDTNGLDSWQYDNDDSPT